MFDRIRKVGVAATFGCGPGTVCASSPAGPAGVAGIATPRRLRSMTLEQPGNWKATQQPSYLREREAAAPQENEARADRR
jgi:hypothetical protein